jgi:hypothetical protein
MTNFCHGRVKKLAALRQPLCPPLSLVFDCEVGSTRKQSCPTMTKMRTDPAVSLFYNSTTVHWFFYLTIVRK